MKYLTLISFLLTLVNCGVKGGPQPPLTPILMSRGEPNFAKVTEKLKMPSKAKHKKIQGDFEESDDFSVVPEEKK